MSNLLGPGSLVVEYRRQYGATLRTLRSPVLDLFTAAIPIQARALAIAAAPGVQQPPVGIGLQSFYQVLTVDDPDVRPVVVRPWWVEISDCVVVSAVQESGDQSETIHLTL